MKRSDLSETYCSIARASAQIVDGWTFVIMREVFFGSHRFNILQRRTGMSPRSLMLRLRKLEDEGILERATGPDGRQSRDYTLTPKGQGLWPVLITLKQWGDEWAGPWDDGQIPVEIDHNDCGNRLHARLTCESCGAPVTPDAATPILSDRFRDERG